MDKYRLEANDYLEGWDIVETDGIETEEGKEDAIVATFYDRELAISYLLHINKVL